MENGFMPFPLVRINFLFKSMHCAMIFSDQKMKINFYLLLFIVGFKYIYSVHFLNQNNNFSFFFVAGKNDLFNYL